MNHPATATKPIPATTHTPSRPASASVESLRGLCVGMLLLLIATCLLWELWLAPLRPGGSWWVIKALPLCLPLAGMLKHRLYTYRALSLLIWFYVAEGAVRAWSDRLPLSQWLAAGECLLALLLFAGCASYIRLRLKNAVATAP